MTNDKSRRSPSGSFRRLLLAQEFPPRYNSATGTRAANVGSPLRTDAFCKPNGQPYLSGTEWEYEDARGAGKHVLISRRTLRPFRAEDIAQWQASTAAS